MQQVAYRVRGLGRLVRGTEQIALREPTWREPWKQFDVRFAASNWKLWSYLVEAIISLGLEPYAQGAIMCTATIAYLGENHSVDVLYLAQLTNSRHVRRVGNDYSMRLGNSYAGQPC